MTDEAGSGYTPTTDELNAAIVELADADTHASERRAACEAYADALAQVGQLLWVTGSLLGPDRAGGKSPFGFGSDDVVGLSVVCQVGSELARGFLGLLDAENLYSAQALLRQIVEVEYLAHAFAERDAIAADWLRTDRKARMRFWSPARLRERANGKFLPEDYWMHCELGGHPTPDALKLLPDHRKISPAIVSADFAGHLFSLWAGVFKALHERREELPDQITDSFPRVSTAVNAWLEADDLTRVIRATHMLRREEKPQEPGAA